MAEVLSDSLYVSSRINVTEGENEIDVVRWSSPCDRLHHVGVRATDVGRLSYGLAGFAPIAPCHLYSSFTLGPSSSQEQLLFHAQAHIPTQPAQAIEEARISHAHEDPGRPEGAIPPPRQGAQAGLGETRFPRIVPCLAADCHGRASACCTGIGKKSNRRERRRS